MFALMAARGRVFGALADVSSVAIGAGVIVFGALSGVIGIVPVIAAQSAGYVLVGMLLICVFGVPAASVESLGRDGGSI